MPVSIRSGAVDGAIQINALDAVVFNAGGVVTKTPTLSTTLGTGGAAGSISITLNPCALDFRNVPVTASGSTTISTTTATTITIPATATLGIVSCTDVVVAVIAVNNGGVVELGVVNIDDGIVLDESVPINTTAISVTSTLSNTPYAVHTLTGVAFRIVGYLGFNLVTSGNWVQNPTKVAGMTANALDNMLERPMTQFQAQDVTYLSNTGNAGMFMISNGILYYACGDNGSNAAYTNPFGGSGQQPKYGVMNGWSKVSLNPVNGTAMGEVIKVQNTGANVYVLTSSGQLFGWGINNFGNLGIGTTTPVTRPTLLASNVVDVWTHTDGGYEFSGNTAFYKDATGAIFAAGNNNYGQCGINTTTNTITWTRVSTLPTTISKIWVRSGSACIVFAWDSVGGTLWAWGYGGYGEYGTNTTTTSYVPVNVTANWGVSAANPVVDVQFATDYYVSAANAGSTTGIRRGDGNIYMTGYNGFNAIGNGNATQQNVPYNVWNAAVSGAPKDFIIHGIGSCYVLTTAGSLYGWGYNGLYQMANGAATNVAVPTRILAGTINNWTNAYFLNRECNSNTYGYYTQCFVAQGPGSSAYVCMGYNDTLGYYGMGTTATVTTGALSYTPPGEWFVKAGSMCSTTYGRTYVAVTNKNNMYCWGYGGYSSLQLGAGGSAIAITPMRHPGLDYNS